MTIRRPASGWNLKRAATHPGEMLREEFLVPLGISQNALALKIRVPATRIGDIVHGRHARHGPAAGAVFRHQRRVLA